MTAAALLAVAIAITLVFDFTNGFYDSANSVAELVATRAATPAACHVAGPLLAGTTVVDTVGGVVRLPAADVLPAVGIGLSLHTTAGAARSEVVARRFRTAITDIDGLIAQIRETVFELDDVLPRGAASIHARVLEALAESGLITSTEFSGKLEGLLPASQRNWPTSCLRRSGPG
ncbi:hypothetical protein [Amycolatopsis sp. MEPSY49]|uniref:hypothetical protein n=1 Tax=Amycolatopsis sp. MEPSY49 TaxID=3151600 RepID=UPI003EF506AD